MSWRIGSRALVAGLLVGLWLPRGAAAQCTQPADARAVGKSAVLAARCNDKKLLFGPSTTCTQSPPPACAGNLVAGGIALAYGANDPPASTVDRTTLRAQLACQKMIGRAVARFLGSKLGYLIRGLPRCKVERRAGRLFDTLLRRCSVTVARDASGVVLPDVGAQCDAAVGAPGSPVDAVRLRECLLSALGPDVDQVAPGGPLRPNIVFILTDDQRFDTIGPLHSVDGTTPVMPHVLGEIANQGVAFQNSFVTTALCCPSRTSILKGEYAHTTGIHTNGGTDGGMGTFQAMNEDVSTLATWLHAAGYRTGLFGKYLNGYAQFSPYVPPGWDEFHAFRAPGYFNYTLAENGVEVPYGSTDADYSADVLRDKVVQFIHQSAGSPFLVEFTPYNPHGPATPAPRHVGSFSGVPPWRPPNYAEPDASDKPAWVQAITWTAQDTTETDAFRHKQLECLQSVDEAVDAVIQALTQEGILDKTFILYAADNGYSWGSHRWKPKQCPYEECMRVPLFVRYPTLIPAARMESGFGLNIDFCETFAELAGAQPDPGVEGRSMVRLLCGTERHWRTDFVEEHWNGQIPTFAQLRGPVWKYVEYVTGETELYNLPDDPYELMNMTDDPRLGRLKTGLAERLRELDPGWPPPSPMVAPAATAAGPNYDNDDEFE